MEFDEPFGLAAVLGAETSAAQDENHGMWSLQFGELAAFRGVVGKLIVGEDRAWNDVGSHGKTSTVGCAWPDYVSILVNRQTLIKVARRSPCGQETWNQFSRPA